jgi:spermidine synthase
VSAFSSVWKFPLVMRILKRDLVFKDVVSQVLTFDYLGALAVSILFPVLLVPHLGLMRSGLLFGLLNVAVALWAWWLFREQVAQRRLAARAGRAVDARRCSRLSPRPAS